jgi:pSer/pThr/pTyr-binding forkhead associated (FHA) protein
MSETDERPPLDQTATQITETRRRPDQRVTAGRSADIRVEVVGGPMDGVTARVEVDELFIGRGASADLSLRLDPLVSTTHARLFKDGSRLWLEDLESSNGTWIGEDRIREPAPIAPGTLFVLGNTCIELVPG